MVYDTIPNGSHIAAAASYSNAALGYPTWVEVLTVNHRGVQVSTKSGAVNKYIQQGANPSVMANSTTANNQRLYGSVAVTSTGNAFGVVAEQGLVDRIVNWQVEDDMVDWKLVGNVNLNGTWTTSGYPKPNPSLA